MMNQGDVVGKMKGSVIKVTENGAMLPSGTPKLVTGTTAPVTISTLSGRAFSASRGAAFRNTKKGNECVQINPVI